MPDSSSSSAVFRARVECVLQAVVAHTATEMVRLFEEALRTTEALQSEQRRSSKQETKSILSAHTAPPTDTESILSESAHTTTAATTETDRRAVGAEVLPAVQQVLSGEEALSLFRPVKDDDSTVTESPGPSQARDVNLSGPLMHTAVVVVGHVQTSGRPLRPRTAGSQTVSQFSVMAVKTEEDAMDDDYEGHDSISVEPEHRYHTDEEDERPKRRRNGTKPEHRYYTDEEDERPKRRRKGTKKRGTKCRVCKKSYFLGLAKHQKRCKVLVCTCSYCGKTFNNWTSLASHELNHTGTRYSCTFCGKTFKYNKSRMVHEHSQHVNTKYGCSDCGKMFEKHLERDQHECIVFTGSFAFSCTECNKGFNRQYILKKHQLAEHPEVFSNKQKVQVEVSEVEVKIEEDYEQDMYGQNIVIDLKNLHSEMDMGLKNQHSEMDMGLKNQHSEQDMGLKNQHSEQDMGLKNLHCEKDVGLTNQVNEQDMGLNIQVNKQDMGLKREVIEQDMGLKNEVHEQDMGLKHQDYGQDIGLNNQVNEQDMGLNIQVNEQVMGLNIQVNEQDMGLMSQVHELDIMGHEGYEQYMGFTNLPESGQAGHFNLE